MRGLPSRNRASTPGKKVAGTWSPPSYLYFAVGALLLGKPLQNTSDLVLGIMGDSLGQALQSKGLLNVLLETRDRPCEGV